MRVQLPKPLHGWRVFIGEVGVIVLGVLIALAGQQLVEDWQWQATTKDATDQLDAELLDSAMASYHGLAAAPCLEQQLDGIDRALAAARTTGRVAPTLAFTPPLHRFSEDSWLNARALQVADHMSAEQVAEYAQSFFYMRDLGTVVPRLHEEAAELRVLRGGVAPVSQQEVGALQRQSGRVRELLGRTELGETLLIKSLAARGIAPSAAEERQVVGAARADFGVCAATPDLDRDIKAFIN